MLDAWLDWTIITVLAGATSTFQILYNEPLQKWYYDARGRDPLATRDKAEGFEHTKQNRHSFIPDIEEPDVIEKLYTVEKLTELLAF